MHILSAYYELGYYGLSRDKSFNLILIKLYSEIGWHKNLTQSRTKKIKDFDDLITSQVLCSSKKKTLIISTIQCYLQGDGPADLRPEHKISCLPG